MKRFGEAAITAVITVILILMTALCVSGTVFCQGRGANPVEEESYRMMEQEYVAKVRDLLEEKGYCNSGVTMNRVIEEDGSRVYTVTIHHRRIKKLDPARQEELIHECEKIDFPVEDCSFCHEFLETDL